MLARKLRSDNTEIEKEIMMILEACAKDGMPLEDLEEHKKNLNLQWYNLWYEGNKINNEFFCIMMISLGNMPMYLKHLTSTYGQAAFR